MAARRAAIMMSVALVAWTGCSKKRIERTEDPRDNEDTRPRVAASRSAFEAYELADDIRLRALAPSPADPARARWEMENLAHGYTDFLATPETGEAFTVLTERLGDLTKAWPLPTGTRIVYGVWKGGPEEPVKGARTYVVRGAAIFDGDDVDSARRRRTEGTNLQVEVQLRWEGARRLAGSTEAHVGDRFAVLSAGRVIMAPIVNGAITNGSLLITMGALDPAEQEAEAKRLLDAIEGK